MRNFFKNFGRHTLIFPLIVVAILICLSGNSYPVKAQLTTVPVEVQGELTLDFILDKLRSSKQPDQTLKNQIIINYIRKSKDSLQFIMTEDEEAQLREAGATDALIKHLAKVSADMEKTAIGNIFLGVKYLNSAIKSYNMREEARRLAKRNRLQKNEEEEKKYTQEAQKLHEEVLKSAEKAIPYFNQAKMLESDKENRYSITAYGNLALVYLTMDKFDEAIDNATKAIELEGTESRYMNRAAIYDYKARTITNLDEKRAIHDKALEDCAKILALNPNNRQAAELRSSINQLWGRK